MGNPQIRPGIVLRIGNSEPRFMRVTHVFDACAYYIWIAEPASARYARRPRRIALIDLEKLAEEPGSSWGAVKLPLEMLNPPASDSSEHARSEAAWLLICPLIEHFEQECNLSRVGFRSSIDQRARATHTNRLTLYRLVLRYYYFGLTRFGLLPLARGPDRNQNMYPLVPGEEASPRQPKRRGRQAVLSDELGRNDFIVKQHDIADMVLTLRSALAAGPTYLTAAHEEYLANAFRTRHPTLHKEYLCEQRPEPVTLRQFRYYIAQYAVLDDDLTRNLRTVRRSSGFLGSTHAAGPGELYEIDSTGGRLYLVSQTDPPVLIGKPTIYFVIDRWSRFIVSVYLSLRPPSYEEVRHALLIAFTSRAKRFSALGVDVDDDRWPVGRVCAVLCPDRGSDFMSSSMEQAVVQDLRIELTPLPPLCPDGKAIVERFIREFKRRMSTSRMKGVFADRPLDPHTKKAARSALTAAVHTLAEAYRPLIELVCDHNNRPHKSLRRNKVLAQAGVKPIPMDAYLWGLKNLTGLRRAPLADADYQRLLLASDKASIANKMLRYRGRTYKPVNEAASALANRSAARPRQVDVRLDKTEPFDIHVPNRQNEWATFRITTGGEAELFGLSLDEEEALSDQEARLWARSDHDSRLERVSKASAKKTNKKPTASPVRAANRSQQEALRVQESSDVKHKITRGKAHKTKETDVAAPPHDDWKKIEEEERLKSLDAVRRLRRR